MRILRVRRYYRMRFKGKMKKDITQYMVYIIFLMATVIFAVWLGGMFFSVTNILNICRQTAMISVMAVGMTFVLATGGIDLTISGVVPVVGLIAAMVLNATDSILLALGAALFLGGVVGVLNGLLITFFTIPPFLVTLGMQGILTGIAMWISNTKSIPIYNETFNNIFGYGSVFGIPVLLFWTLAFMIFGYFLLHNTAFGRKVLAVGGNYDAAEYSGIKVKQILIKTYVLSGMLAATAGLLYCGRSKSAKYTYGEGVEMDVIAAVVLGGTAMSGGTGNIFGAIVGALLMGMINNGLIMGGLSVSQQKIVRGIIIIIAVAIGNFNSRKKKV